MLPIYTASNLFAAETKTQPPAAQSVAINAPIIDALDAQEIEEGAKFSDIKLKGFVTDEDHKFSELKFTVSGNKALVASVAGGKLKVKTPNKNWNGVETIVVTVKDPTGLSANTSVAYTVAPVNDAPKIKKVKGQKIKEGKEFKEIKLDDFITDEDHKHTEITWSAEVESVKGFRDEELSIVINENRIAKITVPHVDWYGLAKVTFLAADGDGAEVSSMATFEVTSVNDAPVMKKIPAQKITEGSEFEEVSLEEYVTDADHDLEKLKFKVSGAKELKVSLDKSSNTLSIQVPNEDWAGKEERLKIEVTDPEGGKDKSIIVLNVTGVNDEPEIGEVQSQEIKEGGQFKSINLEKLVKDKDHSAKQLKWSFRGNKDLTIQIGPDLKAKIKQPSENWHGEENITFTVTDPAGARAETEATFLVESINDQPVVEKKIKGQKIKEGGQFKIVNLDELIKDSDHKDSEISWEVELATTTKNDKGTELESVLDSKRQLSIKIPDVDYYGAAKLKLIATDPDGASITQSAIFEVQSVNDLPLMAAIANQKVDEGGSFESIDLSNYVTDKDHSASKMKFEAKGNKKLKVNITGSVATVKAPNSDFSGPAEKIIFTAIDPAGGKAKMEVSFQMVPVNDAPVLKSIKGQTIKEGQSFTDLDLESLVSDKDDKYNRLKWSFSGIKNLKIKVSGKKAKVTIPHKNWHGTETITAKVTDAADASAETTFTLTVKSVNDIPVFKSVKGQKIKEGAKFTTVDLRKLSSDADHSFDELKWSAQVISKPKKRKKSKVKGPDVIINDAGVAQIMLPSIEYSGNFDVKFSVKDPSGGVASQTANFDVKSVNDLPKLSGFTSQTVKEGGKFKSISLNDKVTDADHSSSKIKWSFTGNKKLKVSIDKKKNFIVQTPSIEWAGQETIELTAKDPEGGKAKIQLKYTMTEVNDLPIISKKLKGQSINEGASFADIKLDQFVNDADHPDSQLKWIVSGGSKLKASISGSRALKVNVPDKEWNGDPETFTLTVTDPVGANATIPLIFTVKSVNDLPIVKKIMSQKIKEGGTFKTIQLDKFVTDSDHSFDELKWSAKVNLVGSKKSKRSSKKKKSKPTGLSVEISKARVATIKTSSQDWFGAATVTFTVVDPAKGKSSIQAGFEVTSVNDLPKLSGFKSQTITEGSKFKSVSLNDKVSDADHSDKQIKWTFKGNKKLKLSIDRKNNFIVKTPNNDWSGSEKITLIATDKAKGVAKIALVYKVTDVNDFPKVKGIKSQKIKEGAQFAKVKLDSYVSDADHKDSELKWTVTGNKALKVKVTTTREAIVEVPSKQWAGTETLIFTAIDPAGAKSSSKVKYTVTAVNDAPVVSKIASQKVKEGQIFDPIDLNKFVKDPDHKTSEIIWYFSDSKPTTTKKKKKSRRSKKSKGPQAGDVQGNNDMFIDLTEKGSVNVSIPDENWNGEETFYFIARDPAGAESYAQVKFSVTAVNDVPKLSPIPDQVVKEGGSFKAISLDKYVNDPDDKDSELQWQIKGGAKIKVTFNKKKRSLSFKTPNKDWSGSETVNLRVKDSKNGIAETSFRLKVLAVNDKPKIKDLPAMTVKEGNEFKSIDLNKYVSDADHESRRLVWKISSGANLKGNISYDNLLTVVALSPSWSGTEKFKITVKDPEGAEASYSFTAKVVNVNDAPNGTRDSYTMDEGGVLKVSKSRGVLSNDTDEDGPSPTKALVSKKPKNGKLKFSTNGSFTYTPKKSFNGSDSFEYQAVDKQKAKSKSTRVDIKVYFKMKDVRK